VLKKALVEAGQVALAGIVLALILVTLGYGPWQRWLPPLVIVAVGRGVLVYIRGRNRGKQINE
jgi:hypothetical protein